MRFKEKIDHRKTEFEVPGKVTPIIEVLEKNLSKNKFMLEPFRYMESSRSKQSFQVMLQDRTSNKWFCCGNIEFNQKKGQMVLIKLFSMDDSTGNSSPANKAAMDRVVYLVIQQLMKEGLTPKK